MSTAESPPLTAIQAHFVAAVMPVVERQAKISFGRHRRDPECMEELTQEAVALAWKRYQALVERGVDPTEFVTAFAARVCQGVRNGRRSMGQHPAKDAMSPQAQSRHSFLVQALPEFDISADENDALDGLRDNTVTPPPDQAAFRIDFPEWLKRLPAKKRAIVEDMAIGTPTAELAQVHATSPGRISQIRREAHEDWQEYHGHAAAR